MGRRLKGLEKIKDKFDIPEGSDAAGKPQKPSKIQQGSHAAKPVYSRSRSSRL